MQAPWLGHAWVRRGNTRVQDVLRSDTLGDKEDKGRVSKTTDSFCNFVQGQCSDAGPYSLLVSSDYV